MCIRVSFEVFFYRRQHDHLKTLADYVIAEYFPEWKNDADKYARLLADIARWGDGQTYYVEDAERVQKILLDEARGKLEETLVEESVRVIAAGTHSALTGVGLESAPALRGHLNLEPRDDSEVLLQTEDGKPLLARRNVGLGRSWIFASDLESRWSSDWIRWPGFATLFSQVLHDASNRWPPEPLRFSVRRERNRLVAELHALDDRGRHRNGVDARVRLSSGDFAIERQLRQRGPGHYHDEIAIDPVADRSYRAELWIGGERRAVRSLYFPSADEQRPALTDRDLLQELAAVTGGRFEPSVEQIFERGDGRSSRTVKLWPFLLTLALLTYLIELALRRTGRLAAPMALHVE